MDSQYLELDLHCLQRSIEWAIRATARGSPRRLPAKRSSNDVMLH